PVVFSKWKQTISRKAGGSAAMADFCSDGRRCVAWSRASEEPSYSPAQAPRCAVGPGMALSIRPKRASVPSLRRWQRNTAPRASMSAMSSSTAPLTAIRYANASRTPTPAGAACSISRVSSSASPFSTGSTTKPGHSKSTCARRWRIGDCAGARRKSAAREIGRPTFDEGSDALRRVFALQDTVADLRNVVDRGLFARLDELAAGLLRDLDSERRVARDEGGQFHRTFVLLTRGDDFLAECDAMGLRGSEFVTQEEVIHRVTPSGAADEAEVRAAKRRDATLGFHLAKTAIVGGDDNVTGEHHFDANGKADALHGSHDWLAAAVGQTERIDVLGGAGLRGRVRPEELRHVQAGGEIGADGAENADPEIGI